MECLEWAPNASGRVLLGGYFEEGREWDHHHRDGPCPRGDLSYTYLMACLAMHCPSIIKLGEEPPEDSQFDLLRRLENSR